MDSEKPDPQVEVEIKLTFLENTITELNQVVYKQQKTIDAMDQAINKLTTRIEELENSTGEDLPYGKPPHH